MHAPQRNQLVWPTWAAWQQLLERPWDAAAQALLLRWQTAQWPLVVTTQRADHAPDVVCLGLPAPTAEGRRKLALALPASGISHCQDFPDWSVIAPTLAPNTVLQIQVRQMRDAGATVQVYGSFAWQHLTGLSYVHPESDLDLRVCVPNHSVARTVVRLLAHGADSARLRLDGELAFSDGSAIAWREYLQWLDGTVPQVLVKSRAGVALCTPPALAQDQPCCA
jgi:phosphoribosyl-dephospho-CoA transferase